MTADQTILPLTRAISLTQPWAWLVVHGGKNVENRGWHLPPAMVGVPFWIHAAKGMSRDDYDCAYDTAYMIDKALAERIPPVKELVRGAIIGQATATECLCPRPSSIFRWHFDDQHGFVLEDVRACEPWPIKGALGFWRVPDALTSLGPSAVRT